MFKNRNHERTEHDDFILNVVPLLGEYREAVEVFHGGVLIGWKIQNKYE